MKKLFLVVFAALFMVAGFAFAGETDADTVSNEVASQASLFAAFGMMSKFLAAPEVLVKVVAPAAIDKVKAAASGFASGVRQGFNSDSNLALSAGSSSQVASQSQENWSNAVALLDAESKATHDTK